jgi:glycosyltransferase involved in cell wall biosynthesis
VIIAQITYSGFGGLGSVVFSLVAADARREHGWWVGFIGDQPLDGSYPARCEERGVGYAAFRSTPGRPYRAWLGLGRWLDTVRPDAIICHSINSILPCRWAAWRAGARLVAVEHTPNQVKTRSEWAASRVCMLLADRVVVLTPEYLRELAEAHGPLFRSAKVAVIPNGIDTEVFRPAEGLPHEAAPTVRLGMAARFSFSKRQDLLVEVIERLAALRPDLKVQLDLAGNGSELGRVRELAERSPEGARVRFVGLLDESGVALWMRGLDIYLHATDGETLSTSLLQAMATGLPIVASDTPGVRNLLAGEEAYGICVPNELGAFAQAILALVDDPARRMALGRGTRTRVFDRFSQNAMLKSYLNVITGCAP